MNRSFLIPLAVLLGWAPGFSCSSGEPARQPDQHLVEAADEPAAKGPGTPDYDSLLNSLVSPPKFTLDSEQMMQFVKLSLHCVDQEYPNKPGTVLASDKEVQPPRVLHPAFFGCFDWHSAVHGHWAMVRVLKKFPKIELNKEIREALDKHLTEANIQVELAYMQQKHHALFERPYGWAWLLRLTAELMTFEDEDAKRWAAVLKPLSTHIATATRGYLEKLSVPVRSGTHQSTAFALTHIQDYAIVAGDQALQEVIKRKSLEFFNGDTNCPTAYEPSGEDFISPCLVEADLMRRILPQGAFVSWLDRFLPPLTALEFAPLLKPVEVKDRKDPRIGHLIGLFLQRAASYNAIAKALPPTDPRQFVFYRLGEIHRDSGLGQMFDSGYGGAHWLASFAIYLLTQSGPY